ncbi:MAG: hypothetical protein V3V62_10890 [bacterium]
MSGSDAWFMAFMFFWLLILTVAFVLHWIKVERHHDFDKHWGAKASEGLQNIVHKGHK